MTTVAVTGAAGFVGKAVLERLDADPAVSRLIGIDIESPSMPVAKLDFRTADVRDPVLANALDGAEVVVHCGLSSEAGRAGDETFAVNVSGTRNLLEAAAKVGARKFVMITSMTVYGAHPETEIPISEDAPLRANPDFAYAYQRMLAEELVAEWAQEHPDVQVTVLRPAIILGPGAEGFVVRHLESPRLPLIRGHETPLQFVHVDDVAAAVALAVGGDMQGAYNVAADGWLTDAEVCRLLGRKPIELPETTAEQAIRWLWDRKLAHVPPGALHFLAYPCVLDTDRLHREGWAPTRSNRELLREFSAAHYEFLSLGPLRMRRRDLYVASFAGVGLLAGLWLGRPSRRR